MKNLFLIFLLIVFITNVNAQKVQSSCTAHDSIVSKYRTDAERMALRRILKISPEYSDSVTIPKDWSDTVVRALIAVYNAKSLPARDTVTAFRQIHTLQQPVMNSFYVAADSTLKWMIKLRKDSLPTGVDSIDWLMKFYHLHVARYYRVNGSYHIVIFETDRNYNLEVLTNIFDQVKGVHLAGISKVDGDGNNITNTITNNYVELVYAYGWGDCSFLCPNKRYWRFRVYYDCSVEYIGSSGSKWNPASVNVVFENKISISPNPFKNKISIANIHSNYAYQLFNAMGQVVKSGNSSESDISDLEKLPKGLYFLQINTENKISNFKLKKEE